jgi:hypothetical protein
MTLRTFIAAIVVSGLVVCTAWMPAIAGDANTKTKASSNKTSALKKGETVQTLAYRFDVYGTYLTPPQGGCSITDPVCTQQLNTDLRTGSGTLFPSVRKPDGNPTNKVDANQKVVTPTND